MLVDRLVNDGTYSVIERKALDKLIAEQNFSNSDRADPSSAAKIGKLLGVNAIIIGSITAIRPRRQEAPTSAASAQRRAASASAASARAKRRPWCRSPLAW